MLVGEADSELVIVADADLVPLAVPVTDADAPTDTLAVAEKDVETVPVAD